MNSSENTTESPSTAQTSPETYRLFVGIQLPQDASRELDLWKGSIQQALPFSKWTHPQDVHVTLSFLGDASAETTQELASDLRQLAAAALPLALHAEGLGVFGPPAAPSILWAGVAGDLYALAALQREVRASAPAMASRPRLAPIGRISR